MRLNRQTLQLNGIDEKQYKAWCKKHKKHFYDSKVKEEFFTKLTFGELFLDGKGNIIERSK